MTLPPLIGLSGHAGSGKDTVGAYLADRGYYTLAFAEPLKRLVGDAFGFSPEQLHGELKEVPDPRFGKSPRWCLQYLGTDILRDIWPRIWLEHLCRRILFSLAEIDQRPLVVTDVRFRDEAELLRGLGAVLWRLERPGQEGPGPGIVGHVSETELDDYAGWDAVIINDGSPKDLAQKIANLLILRWPQPAPIIY